MHRFKELGILYDHSQIPVVLARHTGTNELLALQRIPVSLEEHGENATERGSETESNKEKALVPMSDLLERFPFIREWASIPRHPCNLMLREVIAEGTELFLVSERYSETLVRYLRRQGFIARTQVKNHALHTATDQKSDRAAGAVLDVWISDDVVPDERDKDLREALGMLETVTLAPSGRKGSRFASFGAGSDATAVSSSADFGDGGGGMRHVGTSGVWRRESRLDRALLAHEDSASHAIGGGLNKKRSSRNILLARHNTSAPTSTTGLREGSGGSFAVLNAACGAALDRKISNIDVSTQQHRLQRLQSQRAAMSAEPFAAGLHNSLGGIVRDEQSSHGSSSSSSSSSSSDGDSDDYNMMSGPNADSAERIEDEINKIVLGGRDPGALVYLENVPTAVATPARRKSLAVAAAAAVAALSLAKRHIGMSAPAPSSSPTKQQQQQQQQPPVPPPPAVMLRPSRVLDVVPDHHPSAAYSDIFRVPLADAEVRLVLFQLLSALDSLHSGDGSSGSVSVAHGDVAPRNLVLAQRGNLATLRLTNFRNLKRVRPEDERAGTAATTASAANEQQQQRRDVSWSDAAATSMSASSATPALRLNRMLENAIQASLADIQEEEAQRKRRKSLFVPLGMSTRRQQQQQQSPASPLCAETGDGQPTSPAVHPSLRRPSSFDQFRFRGNRPVSPHSTRSENAIIGREVMSSWNNEEEEAELARAAMREAGIDVSGCFDDDEEPTGPDEIVTNRTPRFASYYTREDVKRWVRCVYAPPELILEYLPTQANPAGDVWSAAVIALELYCARPLIYGLTARDCFFRAAALCGCPSLAQNAEFHRWAVHVTRSQLPERGIRAVPLRSLAPLACESALDLLSKMLRLDPAERLTAKQALQHPFFAMK